MHQNGTLKHKVYGANTPALAQYIYELTPNNADADDLEVSFTAFCKHMD
jgi:hypothetical protein